MPSNVINLSAELEAREHRRKLTPKQETTIRLRGYYSKQSRLIKALRFQRIIVHSENKIFLAMQL
jgi:hypothetical protein